MYRYGHVNTKGEILFELEDYVVTDLANGNFYMEDFIKNGQYPIIVSNPEDSFTEIPLKEERLQFKYIDQEGNSVS